MVNLHLRVPLLVKRIDKNMKNKLTIIHKKGDKDFEEGMVTWFSTMIDLKLCYA